MMAERRVGIGGGVFDPVHYGHLFLFNECIQQLKLDKVLLVPTFKAVHKEQEGLAQYEHRREMINIACESNDKFELSEIEKESGGPSYTIDTIRTLKANNPGVIWYFIVGLDNLEKMEDWHKPDEIIKESKVIVGTRPVESVAVNARFKDKVDFIDIPRLEISSTDIRERIRSGRSIRYLVPSEIENYITEHGLYAR